MLNHSVRYLDDIILPQSMNLSDIIIFNARTRSLSHAHTLSRAITESVFACDTLYKIQHSL